MDKDEDKVCGAMMMLTGKWTKPGVYTVEEFDPDPFLDALDTVSYTHLTCETSIRVVTV